MGTGKGACAPGASKGGPKGVMHFLRQKVYKNSVSSVEVVMGIEEQHVHRKIYILDVSRSSKCTKIVGGWGVYSAPPDPLVFRGPTSKAPTSKGRRWEGRAPK